MESEENNYQVISTNPKEEGGNNVLSLEAEVEVQVRVPLKLKVSGIEIHPSTMLEMIKEGPDQRMGESLSAPKNRIDMALKEDLNEIATNRVIGDFIDYRKLKSREEEGGDFSEYIYGVPEITNLRIKITG